LSLCLIFIELRHCVYTSTTLITMIETPVAYKSTFKISELEKVKLEQLFNDGTKAKVEVPLFTGQEGLEGLVYIVDRFKDACKTLDWIDGIEMFEGFAKVRLQGQAYTYWVDTVLKEFPNDDDQTLDSFEEAINMMKVSFGGGTMARNHILQYIQSNECKKPRKSMVEEHVRRITTLISLANQSTGTDAEITKVKTNELLLTTMPNQWQQNFKLSGHVIADMTIDKFITYFSEVKSVYDSEQQVGRNSTQGRGPRFFGRGYGRTGQFWNRGGGRFTFGRGGRGRTYNNWRRGGGSRYNNYNNFYRGSYGSYYYQRNKSNATNQFGHNTGRNLNRSGRNLNGRFNNNNQGNYNDHQNYWNDNNNNWRQTWNSTTNNNNNDQGNEIHASNAQENRIIEVNHWEATNNVNNREGWDRTRYYYNPSGR
jgi:hypothetical protein